MKTAQSDTIVFLNGRYLPEPNVHVSIYDMAVVLGATVTEMTRTFKHQPFRLEDHVARLFCSLRYARIDFGMSFDEVVAATRKVSEHNAAFLHEDDEIGIIHFVTAGEFHEYMGSAGRAPRVTPTVCIHTFPLPFHYFAEKIRNGAHAVTPATRKIPAQCIDPRIKCRSRMNFFIAEKEAQLVDPDAICLMQDLDGNVTEGTGCNLFIVENGKLVSPPSEQILCGISRQTVIELAGKLGISFVERRINAFDIMNAGEAFGTSTPYCICPIVRINGVTIGTGGPGQLYQRLVGAWSSLVGVDIVRQIVNGAERTQPAQTSPLSRTDAMISSS